MDQIGLVSEQIEAGRKLIERARRYGLGLTGGCWAKLPDDGRPYLYLVTPEVATTGPLAAYRKLGAVQAALEADGVPPAERVEPFSVKLISPNRSPAERLAEHYRGFPDGHPPWLSGRTLAGGGLDGAYIYPASLFRPQPAPEPADAAPPAGV